MTSNPYLLPPTLETDLSQLLAYWNGLKRGGAEMPFADDVDPMALPNPLPLILIEVTAAPTRFRIAMVGQDVSSLWGDGLPGAFVDEISVRHPLHFLHSQASATIEGRAPTYYRHGEKPYARLLLPTWGDGRVSLLLGAFVWR